MNKQLILIKVGGNLITDKTKPCTAKLERIQFFADELLSAYNQFGQVDFVVGNGVGSFAHFPAHKYGLRGGAQTKDQLYGTCMTHNEAQQINNLVAGELIAKHVPVFALSPSSMFTCHDGKIATTTFTPITGLLNQRIIPLVHGDTIYDDTRGTTILSTEEVLYAVLRELRANYVKVSVVYLMTVDGVLDNNGAVIQQLRPNDKVVVRQDLEHDVTGGIVGKIASARKSAQYADKVCLVNGTLPGALVHILQGKHLGTRVLA